MPCLLPVRLLLYQVFLPALHHILSSTPLIPFCRTYICILINLWQWSCNTHVKETMLEITALRRIKKLLAASHKQSKSNLIYYKTYFFLSHPTDFDLIDLLTCLKHTSLGRKGLTVRQVKTHPGPRQILCN